MMYIFAKNTRTSALRKFTLLCFVLSTGNRILKTCNKFTLHSRNVIEKII